MEAADDHRQAMQTSTSQMRVPNTRCRGLAFASPDLPDIKNDEAHVETPTSGSAVCVRASRLVSSPDHDRLTRITRTF